MGAACAWHHAAGRADLGLVLMVASLLSTNAATLEDIAMSAGTDKARDEHGFVAAYAMLFDGLRDRVRNMTEIGIHMGKSLRMWHAYFRFANIYGIDISVQPQALQVAKELALKDSRVRILPPADSTHWSTPFRLKFKRETMDLIVDDGDHRPWANARTLVNFWPLVKPGGYYIIEDVTTGGNVHGHFMNRKFLPLERSGYAWLAHNGTDWPAGVREIYEGHDVFLADTLLGAREFDDYQERHSSWLMDRVNHNSHMIIIRKRLHGPRRRQVKRGGKHIGASPAPEGVRAGAPPPRLLRTPSRTAD